MKLRARAAPGLAAPRTPLLASVLDLPGRLADGLTSAARAEEVGAPIPEPEVLARVAAHAAAAPRANAYLALEPGLRIFEHEGASFAWAGARRHAFAVGGLLAADEGAAARGLRRFRAALGAAGYRRGLLFPVSDAELPILAEAGWSALPVGAEAIVLLPSFSLAGKRHADLRQMVNRARKRHDVVAREVDAETARRSGAPVFARWLAARPVPAQMRLLVGTPCFEAPFGRRYFLAERLGTQEVMALVTVTPGSFGQVAGIDVMARAPDAPAGTMDLLITHVAERLRDEGLDALSLGACPMAVAAAPARGPRERLYLRLFSFIYRSRTLSRLFHFEHLARFKQKFDPEWRTVHLGGWPRIGARSLYAGCRMWGLFGPRGALRPAVQPALQVELGPATGSALGPGGGDRP